jgi:hypothetical protein
MAKMSLCLLRLSAIAIILPSGSLGTQDKVSGQQGVEVNVGHFRRHRQLRNDRVGTAHSHREDLYSESEVMQERLASASKLSSTPKSNDDQARDSTSDSQSQQTKIRVENSASKDDAASQRVTRKELDDFERMFKRTMTLLRGQQIDSEDQPMPRQAAPEDTSDNGEAIPYNPEGPAIEHTPKFLADDEPLPSTGNHKLEGSLLKRSPRTKVLADENEVDNDEPQREAEDESLPPDQSNGLTSEERRFRSSRSEAEPNEVGEPSRDQYSGIVRTSRHSTEGESREAQEAVVGKQQWLKAMGDNQHFSEHSSRSDGLDQSDDETVGISRDPEAVTDIRRSLRQRRQSSFAKEDTANNDEPEEGSFERSDMSAP